MKAIKVRITSIILATATTLTAFAMSSTHVHAGESGMNADMTSVQTASSVQELSIKSEAGSGEDFFKLDTTEDHISHDMANEEINGDLDEILESADSTVEKQKEVTEYLNDTGLYDAHKGTNGQIEVTSLYANMRLRLEAPQQSSIQAYGANEAVYFEDHYLLSYDNEESAKEAYDKLIKDHGEDKVFIDYPVQFTAYNGWGTKYMGLDKAATRAGKDSKVKVAVVDTGINASHKIFTGTQLAGGYDFANGDSNPADDNGHGTAVSGIIAESTPASVSILPVKALSANGSGSMENLLNAIAYADSQGADIINVSAGLMLGNSSYAQKYFAKVDSILSKHNALIICAAGNESTATDDNLLVPGGVPSTVCVSAINSSGSFCTSFSNYGSAVDFAAPGNAVKVAKHSSPTAYSSMSGTSFATPYVSAAAALLKAENTSLNASGIKQGLIKESKDLGTKGKDAYYGNGCPVLKAAETTNTTTSTSANTTATNSSTNAASTANSGINTEDAADTTDSTTGTVEEDTESDTEEQTAEPKPASGLNVYGIVNRTYTGAAITQEPIVKDGETTLKAGKEYTITFKNTAPFLFQTIKYLILKDFLKDRESFFHIFF
jgi:subtilisin family serine protease